MEKSNYNKNTTDKQNILLWNVTKDDKVIGSVTRRKCHNETTRPWHRTVHIYLFDSKGNLYLTQRSFTKDTAPGAWTISAGGHVEYGDNYEDTANRELFEELNIQTELKMIDKLSVDYGPEKEMIAIFAGKTNKKPSPNEQEVVQIKLYDFDRLVKDFLSGKFSLSPGSLDSFGYVLKRGTLVKFRKKILQNFEE